MVDPKEPQSFSYIDPASRIQAAISTKQLNDKLAEQRSGDRNDPASRWQRGGVLASRLAEHEVLPAPAVHSSSPKAESGPGTRSSLSHAVDDRRSEPQTGGSASQHTDAGGPASSFISRLPFNFKSRREEEEYIEESKLLTKRLEDQNILEMLDPAHRYGSNLKHYHRYWNLKADTDQNFLHWLDEGDGKHLSLDECPRAKLEKERIVYLTPDQRRNYMTYIDTDPCPPQELLARSGIGGGNDDDDLRAKLSRLGVSASSFGRMRNSTYGKGRLRWCKTGELVSTSKYDHGDLGQGRGIALRGSEEWKAAVRSGEAAEVVRSDKVKVRKRRDSGTSSASYTSWNESDLSSLEGGSLHPGSDSSDDRDPGRSHSAPRPTLDEKQQSRRERWLEKANLGPKYLIKSKLGLYAAKDRQQHIDHGGQAEDRESGADGRAGVGESDEGQDALIRRRKADTWLFVADLAGNLYLGIKTRGHFQHSSFLSGSIVAAAGILKVKDGIITSIYPWSGHYRSGGEHFEALINRLRERGLDTSGINVRKSKMVIEAVNRYGRYRKAKDRKKLAVKERIQETWRSHVGGHSEEAEQHQAEQHRAGQRPASNNSHHAAANGFAATSPSPKGKGSSTTEPGSTAAAAASKRSSLETERPQSTAEPVDGEHQKAIEHLARAMSSGLKADQTEQ